MGFAGLLDLGYVAFYAVGAYCYALLASPAFRPPLAVLDHPADRRGGRVPVRHAAGRADAQAARRLPRDRHAGLRRDHPHLPQQPVAPVNITNGPQGITLIDPFRIGDFSFAKHETFSGLNFSGPIKYYYLLPA